MHYYKRNLGDYAKKAGKLSMLQHGSYTLLIDACYDREQFPTLEEAIDWTWASTKEEVEAVTFVLKKFFTLEDGVYVQERIQEEIAEYHAKATTNQRIATERETKRKQNNSVRAPVVNEAPPNHKPITNNQEPRERESAAKAPRPLKKCPVDFLITQEMQSWAIENAGAVDLKTETDKFMDYTFSSTRSDWLGTWRNWMRKAQEYAEKHKPDKPYETPYARSMREKYEQITPMIAAKNPNAPKKINPNDFINGKGISDHERIESPRLAIVG